MTESTADLKMQIHILLDQIQDALNQPHPDSHYLAGSLKTGVEYLQGALYIIANPVSKDTVNRWHREYVQNG
jgi:hypothetical protein